MGIFVIFTPETYGLNPEYPTRDLTSIINLNRTQYWERYGIIIDKGDIDSWENTDVSNPTILKVNGTYMMWYSGTGTNYPGNYHHDCIGLATSKDGRNWTKHPDNPVFTFQGTGWEDWQVEFPLVIYENSTFKMWYGGYDGFESTQIGYATSPDGINWTRYQSDPVLPTSTSGWDSMVIHPRSVIKHEGTYLMYYNGIDSWSSPYQVGLATSSDGINWVRYGSNPIFSSGSPGAWDTGAIPDLSVVRTSDGFMMWYHSSNSTTQGVGYAVSDNGISWEKRTEPVMLPDPNGWDNIGMSPEIVELGNETWMYYGGFNSSQTAYGSQGRIMLARLVFDTSPPSIIDDRSQSIATTGDPYEFLVEVQDDFEIWSVSIEYWFEGYNRSIINLGRKSESDLWSGRIMMPNNTLEEMYYRINVSDRSGNWFASGVRNVELADNDPPEVISYGTYGEAMSGEHLQFHAEVEDNINVEKVELHCWYDGDEPFIIEMQPTRGSYSVSILVNSRNWSNINYFIKAVDTSSNEVITEENSIFVDIVHTLVVENDLSDAEATTGDPFIFCVSFQNTHIIDSVFVEYRLGYGELRNLSMAFKNGTYSMYVSIPNHFIRTLYYRFSAMDELGMWTMSDWFERAVIDNDPPVLLNESHKVLDGTGNIISFDIEAHDNIEVGGAFLSVVFSNGEEVEEIMYGSSGRYSCILEGWDLIGGYLSYRFHINDSFGNLLITPYNFFQPKIYPGDDDPPADEEEDVPSDNSMIDNDIHPSSGDDSSEDIPRNDHPNDSDFIPIIFIPIVIIFLLIISFIGVYTALMEDGKWKFIGALVPLRFASLKEKQVNEEKAKILFFVVSNPGSSLLDVYRGLGISQSKALYYLRILEKENGIRSERDGKFRRLYPTKGSSEGVVYELRKIQADILRVVTMSPGISQSDIARVIGKSRQLILYNIRALERYNLISIRKNNHNVKCYPGVRKGKIEVVEKWN